MTLYIEGKDDDKDEDEENSIPELEIGQEVKEEKINPKQSFTEPPARYTEASLVKELEAKGIGRPSTYAPTISTIIERRYIEKLSKQLVPTELGKVVNKLLVENFGDIINVKFTADIEKQFDEIAEGNEEWKQVLRDFYKPFKKELDEVDKKLEHVVLEYEETDVPCDKCGRMMVIKFSKYGKFLACPGYPECKNIKPYVVTADAPCPVCGAKVQVRRTRSGKNYYICENNKNTEDTCKYISWNKPVVGEKWEPTEVITTKKKTTTKTRRKTTKRKTTKRTAKKK
jgi:DNA topoisomerase-1